MKYFIVFILTSLSIINTLSGQKKSEENLLIRNKVVDFGIVKEDTILNARYYLMNKGNTEIKINYVNPDCSCTDYYVSNYTIKPNDSIFVDLSFDTKQKYGVQKLYTIISADTETKMYKLTLKAIIVR